MDLRFLPLLHASFVLLAHKPQLLFAVNMQVGNASVKCIERERQSLLAIKQGFIDDSGRLSSWGNRENQKECCKWEGVQCSSRTGHVVKLELRAYSNYFDNLTHFEGTITSSLAELHHLNYLDLSDNYFHNLTHFPNFIASLIHLKYLNLSHLDVRGPIPYELGDLFHLQYLDLEGNFLHVEFSKLLNLSRLVHLNLANNNLTWSIPHQLGNLSSLQFLDLSSNSFYGIIPHQLGNLSSLQFLHLSFNSFYGRIPHSLQNLYNLQHLDLSFNQIDGGIPKSLFDLCNLRILDLSVNNLAGQFEEFVPTSSHCANKSLQELHLYSNRITGSVPDLSQFHSLEELDLDSNQLNGTLSESIGQLSNLKVLTVANNSLQGVVTKGHFLKLSKLIYLDFSFNELVFNITSDWVPSFQLHTINLASCKLGPTFPIWLQTQKNYSELDISSAKISDTIPSCFWDLPPNVESLNLSHNQIRGEIPKFPMQSFIFQIDLSSNLFEGWVPSGLAVSTQALDLSNNKFTDANSLLCPNMTSNLVFLDLSNNQFSGELPECWTEFDSLKFLNLANNRFYGKISPSMGSLRRIEALHLGNNMFMGEIPLSLNNCTTLRTFDVVNNKLSGLIPSWIGDGLRELRVISLRSNMFFGRLPLNLCQLSHIQILDLSLNNISGSIPKCFNNLTAMATQENSDVEFFYFDGGVYSRYSLSIADSASLIWKGKESIYKSTLGLVKSIDLSDNKLTGKIPSEVMDLVRLVSLNLSRNMISGEIPAAIGRLKSLDFLDLSKNYLSGRIPSELSQIDRLGVLDLSYNNLSGEIPLGTQLQSFNASTYMGNIELCGAPLLECPRNQTKDNQNDRNREDNEEFFSQGFYISLTIGFSTGFWGVCSLLWFNKSWRYAYFKLLGNAYDKVYVVAAINMAKLRRRNGGSS